MGNPLSGLTPDNRDRVMTLIRQLREGQVDKENPLKALRRRQKAELAALKKKMSAPKPLTVGPKLLQMTLVTGRTAEEILTYMGAKQEAEISLTDEEKEIMADQARIGG